MGSMLGLAPLIMMVILGLWWDLNSMSFFYSAEYEEASFRETCDRVAMWVDDYRREHSCLPDNLDAEGFVKGYGENRYIDTTKWDRVEFIYQHDENSYKLESINDWLTFKSTPEFEGYVFFICWERDEITNEIRIDSIPRRQ